MILMNEKEERGVGSNERPQDQSDYDYQQSQEQPQQTPQQQPQSQRYQQQPAPGQQPGYYQQQSMFSSANFKKLMGMALVIGIIIMFVGGIFISSATYVKPEDSDAMDTRRVLKGTGLLISSIGLFVIGLLPSLGYYLADDLKEKQKSWTIRLICFALIAFAILQLSIFSLTFGF